MAVALAISFAGFTACSNEQGDASLVSEARADPVASKDYGWRTSPSFSTENKDEVHEYH